MSSAFYSILSKKLMVALRIHNLIEIGEAISYAHHICKEILDEMKAILKSDALGWIPNSNPGDRIEKCRKHPERDF